MFICFWARDRVWVGEGQRKRETQNPKQAPGSELSAQSLVWGSNSRAMRSWPESKSDVQLTELPRHLFKKKFFLMFIYFWGRGRDSVEFIKCSFYHLKYYRIVDTISFKDSILLKWKWIRRLPWMYQPHRFIWHYWYFYKRQSFHKSANWKRSSLLITIVFKGSFYSPKP